MSESPDIRIGSTPEHTLHISSARRRTGATRRQWAGLGKDLMLLGNGSRLEVWDRERYLANEEATLAGPMPDGLANLVQQALDGPEVNLDQAAALPTQVKLYPQDKWAWGWNNSSEVWNGRLAMLGFSAFLLELISGRGPLHSLGLL